MGFPVNEERSCICVIAHKPNFNWLEFLQVQTHYDTFLVIDDNDFNYGRQYKDCFPDVKVVQIDDVSCTQAGFSHLNYLLKKPVSGWDKAIYYFSFVNRNYDRVWFLEDDVFFYNEETLKKVDTEFPSQDLLSANCTPRSNHPSWRHWERIQIELKPPHFISMVCAIRVSRPLLKAIKDYAEERGRLFFLEAFFPTIARHRNLKCANPKALKTIVFRRNWKAEDMNQSQLFHPIKNINLHALYRKQIRNF